MPGSLTLMGMSAGLPGGQVVDGPVTMQGTNQIGAIVDMSLVSGDNTFDVPTGSAIISIYFGSPTTATITMRTNVDSDDTGFPVGPCPQATPFVALPLVDGVTEIILNSSAAVANIEIRFK